MGLKSFSPTTPSLRGLISVDRGELWKGKPEKSLTRGFCSSGGRNNKGRITSAHRGGGHKKRYRFVDFRRRQFDSVARVKRLEFDPNRSAFLALLEYEGGEKSYILAPQHLKVGTQVLSSQEPLDIKVGNATMLKYIPTGVVVHNVELNPGQGGKMVRSAGTFSQVLGKSGGYVQIRLSSGEQRLVQENCMATIGSVSNPDNANKTLGKAGRSRWLGRRPVVRGVAMNPVDHPHGGGEGRTSGGRHPVTPWGKPTKGYKTRNKKTTNRLIVTSRHKAKKR